MSFEIKIPSVGESITEVTISTWYKKDGESVEMDEVICELESEKATFELNAETNGILKIITREGETVAVGSVVATIEPDAKSRPGSKSSKNEVTPKAGNLKESTSGITGKKIEMKVPAVGESITEVTIASWLKKDGDFVALDEVIAEIESEKATFELTAEANGILRIKVKQGTTLPIGAVLCVIEESSAPVQTSGDSTGKTEKKQTEVYQVSEKAVKSHPSPVAARILEENKIPADKVPGTGPGGKIMKEDAIRALSSLQSQPAENIQEEVAQTPVSHSANNRSERRVKLSTLRRTLAKRLVVAKNETAMLTTFNEVNMGPVMELRKKYKDQFKEKYEVGLGFMSFFTKACCTALKEWPAVNAMIDGDDIIYHDYCDISIAVSAPKGLVVPVIRNAESLSFAEIEKEVARLAGKARENKLSIEEMTGGTFTITNGGVFGSMLSTPILNIPQAAILGMHNIVERPVAENGQVVIRPVMYLALSYDHRIIDGRESVSFLVRVKQLLEDPSRLLLEI